MRLAIAVKPFLGFFADLAGQLQAFGARLIAEHLHHVVGQRGQMKIEIVEVNCPASILA